MKRLVAALFLLALPFSAFAGSESDYIAALEVRISALEARLAPAPAPSRATVAARRALLAIRSPMLGAFGVPVLGGGFGSAPWNGGTVGGATTFSDDVTFNGGTGALGFAAGETLVPADGTLNVTGGVISSTLVGTNDVGVGTVLTIGGLYLGTNGFQNIQSATADGATSVAIRAFARANYTTAGAKILSGGDSGSTTYAEKFFFMLDGAPGLTPTALALSGAHTALPVGGIVEVTCTGAQTWTPTETSATNGEIHHIVNVGADALTMDHVAGQVLLNGGADVVLGQMDALTIYYSTAASAWVQLGATSNN